MMNLQRVIIFVLDGVGAGAAPDAEQYGDIGSNSLTNTAEAVGGLRLPNLEAFGFGRITPMKGVSAIDPAKGSFGKMTPRSAGKDFVTGHWELMGIYLKEPFPIISGRISTGSHSEIQRINWLRYTGEQTSLRYNRDPGIW